MKTVDAEIVGQVIVACKKCGQKNRLYKRVQSGVHRCGSCRTILVDPFSRKKGSRRVGAIFGWLILAGVVLLVIAGIAGNSGNRATTAYTPPTSYQPQPSTTDNSTASAPPRIYQAPTYQPTPPPTFTPVNNVILFSAFPAGENLGEFTVSNGTGTHAVAKFIDSRTDQKVLSFTIGARQQAYVTRIPDGDYKLIFAFGNSLYIGTDRFAAPKGFSQFDKLMDFRTIQSRNGVQYSKLSVTLNAVVGGNARTSSISKTEFERY